MNYADERLSIEEVEKITSKLMCDYKHKIDVAEQEKLENQLNAMFGQWREAD